MMTEEGSILSGRIMLLSLRDKDAHILQPTASELSREPANICGDDKVQ